MNWEPKIEKKYDAHGVLQSQKIQRTPDGPWENYYPDKAFPSTNETTHDRGMDLRDYFAAKAMQGICAGRDEAGVLVHHGYKWIASESYQIADAMMKAREE